MSLSAKPDLPECKAKVAARPMSVAVLMATFNGEQYLPEFLDSLCAQTYSDFCLYVRDDGSCDSTLDILKSYEDKLDIRWLPGGARLGAFQNFFRLLQEAGDHSCFMPADQDDYWYPDKIERAWQAVGWRPDDIVLYCTRLQYVDASLNKIGLSRIPRLLTFENAVVENIAPGCSTAITKQVKRSLVVPGARYAIPHDWWLYLYCSSQGSVIYDAQPSVMYRLHANNTVGAAPGRVKEFVRRSQRFSRKKPVFLDLYQQFLHCHGHLLSEQNRDLLQYLISSSKTFRGRLRIALRPPFSRQRRLDNLLFRVMYLLGRF